MMQLNNCGTSMKYFFACVVVMPLLVGCSHSNPTGATVSGNSQAELPTVATAKAVRKELAQKTEQPARIEAYATTPIHAKISGFVDQLMVDIGDKVHGPRKVSVSGVAEPGQVLAVLSAPELHDELKQKQAAIAQAEADIEQAKAAIEVAQSMAQSVEAEVAAAEAGRLRAEAHFARWQSESQRLTSLATNQTVTQKVADEALAQMRAADATRDEASAQLKARSAKAHEANTLITKAQADLRSVEARLQVAKSEFARVKTLTDYLTIRAPFNGVVTVRNVDLGHLVNSASSANDSPMFVVVQHDRLRIFVSIPETEAALVDVGRKAVIKVPALGAATFEGVIARTSWALQEATRTLDCQIDVSNPDGALRAGMYANAEITIAHKNDALAIPKTAVIQLDGQAVCLAVAASGSIEAKPVKTGIRTLTEVEIASGLDGSEDIIIANAAAFKPGQQVNKTK